MGTQNRRKRVKMNQTVQYMRQGLMRFKRRLDIPMWHIDHLNKTIEMFEEGVDELKRIRNSNTLRNSDKAMYAQGVLAMMNKQCAIMTPADPRAKGCELLEYTDAHGLIDKRGEKELLAREDLDEPVEWRPYRTFGHDK